MGWKRRAAQEFDELGGGEKVFRAVEKVGENGRDDCGVAVESGVSAKVGTTCEGVGGVSDVVAA